MADILLVDDNEELRALIRTALEGAGHQVRDVADGAAALRVYDEQPPAMLIIMDLVMRGKEGIETIVEIRHRHSQVKIIAISGQAGYLKMAQQLGADKTLAKPFSHTTLLALVDSTLASLDEPVEQDKRSDSRRRA